MARRRMTGTLAAAAGLAAAVAGGRPATGAAVPLASLGGATVQGLIDLGGDGVTAGGERYYDFSYFAPPASPAAADVRVQGVAVAGNADELRFIGRWLATAGRTASGTVSFDVAPTDPATGIDRISLTANGTAPVVGAGTFATATTLATTPAGVAVVSILSTYDDGRTTPVDTTTPDVDSAAADAPVPEASVSVTDTIVATSGGVAGVASASVLQNTFTTAAVPEPAAAGAVGVGLAASAGRRKRRRSADTTR